MTLTVLLILAGFAATDEAPRATTAASDDAATSTAVAATPARRESLFEALRKKMAIGRPTPLLIPSPSASPSPDPAESGERQLTNRRTGVTCTLRIVSPHGSVDPGAVADTGDGRPDPIVRNDVSPCVDGGGAINAGRRR
jgi:hypothetical protein